MVQGGRCKYCRIGKFTNTTLFSYNLCIFQTFFVFVVQPCLFIPAAQLSHIHPRRITRRKLCNLLKKTVKVCIFGTFPTSRISLHFDINTQREKDYFVWIIATISDILPSRCLPCWTITRLRSTFMAKMNFRGKKVINQFHFWGKWEKMRWVMGEQKNYMSVDKFKIISSWRCLRRNFEINDWSGDIAFKVGFFSLQVYALLIPIYSHNPISFILFLTGGSLICFKKMKR